MRLDQRKHDKPEDRLSEREQQLIAAILDGHVTAKQIASRLAISERTVNTHLQSIFQITGTNNKVALAIWAMRSGEFAATNE